MNARRSSTGVGVTMSAAAFASGALAGDPVACALAAVSGLAALVIRWPEDPLPYAATGSTAIRWPAPDLRITHVFRAFRGDEGRSAGVDHAEEHTEASAPDPSPPSPPEPEKTGPDDTDDADPAYEEFAAGLEEGDTEEISFLPPYVSGGEAAEPEDDSDESWEPPVVESPLLQELNDVLDPRSRMPMPRRFALGTVAILRNLLDPDQVSRILDEQRRYPRLRFGDIAVELGLLTLEQRDEMVRAQQEGVFSDEEIRDAKRRLESHYTRGGRG